jgi:hypothetical protein
LPGSQVKADSILLEMSNQQAEQAALDAQASVESGRSRISESACQASERFDEPEGQRCATPGRVTRMIVLQASAWIMVGAAARVHGSFVVTHRIRCLLFGIQPFTGNFARGCCVASGCSVRDGLGLPRAARPRSHGGPEVRVRRHALGRRGGRGLNSARTTGPPVSCVSTVTAISPRTCDRWSQCPQTSRQSRFSSGPKRG